MINEEEDREGYDVKIDKKSILRLLQKLAKDNLVKNIKLTLRMNNREKNLTFICDPSIGTDHSVIQSAVEQAKIKFCLLGSQKIRSIIQKQSQQNEDGTKKIFEEDKKGLEAFNTSKKSKSSTLNFQYDFVRYFFFLFFLIFLFYISVSTSDFQLTILFFCPFHFRKPVNVTATVQNLSVCKCFIHSFSI